MYIIVFLKPPRFTTALNIDLVLFILLLLGFFAFIYGGI